MALQQYQLNGTYFGFDPATKSLVAFPDEKTLRLYFPNGIDPKAQALPFSSNDGLVVTAMQNAGKQIDPNTLKPLPQAQAFDPTKFGIDPSTWSTLTPGEKAFVESTTGFLQNQFDSGAASVSINQDLLNKALQSAQTDPNITAKYGDAAKTAANDVSFALNQINANWGVQNTQQGLELEKQRKDLADQIASQGQAFSGFRKQAENLLGSQQASVIQSSRSQLQQNLQNLGRAYEKQYGSQALAQLPSPLSVGSESYTPLGGITGSAAPAKQAEIEGKQLDIYNREKL